MKLMQICPTNSYKIYLPFLYIGLKMLEYINKTLKRGIVFWLNLEALLILYLLFPLPVKTLIQKIL